MAFRKPVDTEPKAGTAFRFQAGSVDRPTHGSSGMDQDGLRCPLSTFKAISGQSDRHRQLGRQTVQQGMCGAIFRDTCLLCRQCKHPRHQDRADTFPILPTFAQTPHPAKQLKNCSAIREDVTRSSKAPKIDRKLLDRLARRRPKHSFNNMPGRSKSMYRISGCGAENTFSRDDNTEFSPSRFAFCSRVHFSGISQFRSFLGPNAQVCDCQKPLSSFNRISALVP